jgi:prepilin peptidase CpaA
MLSPPLPAALPAVLLVLVLMIAVWHDVRTRRIPNRLILAGAGAAFLVHALLPSGLLFSLAGCVLGLLLLLPFYAMRALGAGDVKLMAVVGAFLGPFGVMGATLLTMLAGGVLALAVALGSGQLLQVIVNLQQMLRGARFRGTAGASAGIDAPVVVTGKLAYAVAIACGTAAQLLLASVPAWRFFS